jgi:preprotein translocase subunit SecG
MESLGNILAILGAIFAFVSALGLAFSRQDDDDVSAGQWVDVFLLGGLFSFIFGFSRGISDAFRDRSSSSFILAVLFIISILVLSVGIWLN